MATREEKHVSKKFLEIKNHSIVEVSKEPRVNDDGVEFTQVEVFNPSTQEKINKYYDYYGAISGFVTGIDVYDTEKTYPTRFQGVKISLDDDAILNLPIKSPAYDIFCKVAENIDYSQPVRFEAFHNRKKDRTGLSVQQNGVSIDWNYTLDNPGDCPPWEKDDMGDWNTSKQRAFFIKLLKDKVVPMVEKAQAQLNGEEVTSTPAEPAPKASAATAGKIAGKTAGKTASKAAETSSEDMDSIPF